MLATHLGGRVLDGQPPKKPQDERQGWARQQLFPDVSIQTAKQREAHEQAREAGKRLKELVKEESIYFYVSPFWRARSTFEEVASDFPRAQFDYSEEPRLREQEWGYLYLKTQQKPTAL